MSTTQIGSPPVASPAESPPSVEVRLDHEPRREEAIDFGANPGAVKRSARREDRYGRRKTLRRLQGFVIQDCGRELKVGFVETRDGAQKMTQYFVPADFLKHAGVLKENQQFELDEALTKYRDGSVSVTYHVRPCAAASEGFADPLSLDPEHRQKLARLLQKLGDAAG